MNRHSVWRRAEAVQIAVQATIAMTEQVPCHSVVRPNESSLRHSRHDHADAARELFIPQVPR